MGFLNPTTEELADSAIEKLHSGEATSVVDAARKARLGRGLDVTPARVREITAELGRRSQRAVKARRAAVARAEKIGQ